MIISIIILITLFEVFLVTLFVMYKQGKIDDNPFIALIKKEWLILFYAFFRWRKKQRTKEDVQVFSYHKNSSYFWLFLALVHEQIIEMFVFHIYLKTEEPEIATIMLVLHIYSVLYIMGDYNLVRNSPLLLSRNKIVIKIGVRRELNVHLREIENIQPVKIAYNRSGGIIHEKKVFHVTAYPRIITRIFGITDEAKYEIVLKHPVQARGYFGQKKEVEKVYLYIDKPDEFVETLQEKIDTYVDQPSATEEVIVKKEKMPIINWKVYVSLLFINVLGALSIAPYAIARESMHEQMGISQMEFVFFYIVQVLLESAVFLFLALWMMKKVNFQVPLIESFFNKEKSVHQLRNKLLKATLYGLLTGGVIILVSLLVSSPLGVDNSSIKEIPWWLAIFGSFGAAVNEESIFRLFLVTFIVWSLVKVRKRKATPLYTWTGISVAALVFGVMHYSVAILNFDMTVGLFASMLLINGIGGIVFGALFVFMGLEFAIIAHFMANFLIQVIGPLFI